jgi:maltooligosyltrehalose trehalohydrolase
LELGAHTSKSGTGFRVWAPKASSVSLRILGGSSEILMEPEEKGYFRTFVEGVVPGAKYFYLLNGDRQRPDPVSRFQPEGVHGPSEVVDPYDFEWKDSGWTGIPLEEMVIYEIHTGTFTSEGTFDGILRLLDYLRDDLGVTALELMPVAQFPGERNWGYDGTYSYAPQNSYGGPRGLKRLINACHRKGLAVILDVVYNHLGPEGNYLGDYGPYFTDRYRTPWGSAINFDGPGSDEVRRFFIDNALYWVTEYHMDGLRIDAIHGIFDFSAQHILYDLGEAVHRQAKKLGRRKAVIAESDLNDVRVINPLTKGGYGLDAQWNDDFHHCLHTLLTGESNGYYRDFGEMGQMAKALREGFVYSGQYSLYRKRRHGSPSKHLPPKKFVVFCQNHDQVGNRLKGDRLSTLVPFEALKVAAGMVLFSPNIPLLFMGEEYGEEAPFQYFVSHSDPGLIEAVRRGRKEEFASFQWGGEVPDPQAEGTFLRSKMNHPLREREKNRALFQFYRRLIKLRKEILSLWRPGRKSMEVVVFEEKKTLLMKRMQGEERAVWLFNLSRMPVEIETRLEKGTWQKVLDSSSPEWGDAGGHSPVSVSADGSEITFPLEAFSLVLYRKVSEEAQKFSRPEVS